MKDLAWTVNLSVRALANTRQLRFATELLVSHLGTTKVGEITQEQGREVLSQITVFLQRAEACQKTQSLTQLHGNRRYLNLCAPWHPNPGAYLEHFLTVLERVPTNIRPSEKMFRTSDQSSRMVVATLLQATGCASALLFGLLMRSGEICGLLATDVISKGNILTVCRLNPMSNFCQS